VAAKLNRGGIVDLDLGDRKQEPLMHRLGFRKAQRIRDFRPSGVHLRQSAPEAYGSGWR
jgi:hypothetical protein